MEIWFWKTNKDRSCDILDVLLNNLKKRDIYVLSFSSLRTESLPEQIFKYTSVRCTEYDEILGKFPHVI